MDVHRMEKYEEIFTGCKNRPACITKTLQLMAEQVTVIIVVSKLNL